MTNTVSYIYEIMDRYTKPLRRLSKETRRFKKSVDLSDKAVQKYTRSLMKMAVQQHKNSRALAANVKHLNQFAATVPRVTRGMGKMVAAGRRLESTVTHLRNMKTELRGVASEASRASMKMLGVKQPVGVLGRKGRKGRAGRAGLAGRGAGVGQGLQGLQGAVGGLVMGAGLVAMIRQSVLVEDAIQDIARVTDLSAAELLSFDRQLEVLSETLGKTKIGMAQMAFEGMKLGLPVSEVKSFVMLASRTAIAFDMVDQVAGELLGSIKSKMGLSIPEIEKLMDSMNFLADTTATTGVRVTEVVQRLAGTFSILKFPTDVAAGFAAFSDVMHVSARLAATNLEKFIEQLRLIPGMTKKLRENPLKTITDELEKIEKMDPRIQAKYIRKVYKDIAGRWVEKAISNMETYHEVMGQALSPKAIGSMERELKNRLRRASTTFKIFAITVENTMGAIGDIIKPFALKMALSIAAATRLFREFARAHPGLVKFAAAIAGIILAVIGLAMAGGIMMLTMGPVFALLAAFAGPIALAVASISFLVMAFKSWIQTGHPVIQMMKDIGKDIGDILAPFGELFAMVSGLSGEVDALAWVFDKLGFAIMAILGPIKAMFKGMKGSMDISVALMTGDFAGALDITKATMLEMADASMEGVAAFNSMLGLGFLNQQDPTFALGAPQGLADAFRNLKTSPEVSAAFSGLANDNNVLPSQPAQTTGIDNAIAAGRNRTQAVDVGVDIGVSAGPNTTVDHTEITLDGGQNVAYSGR